VFRGALPPARTVSVRTLPCRHAADLADDGLVSEIIEAGKVGSPSKRIHYTAEEKRRIVEATLLCASLSRC
jgi:hypothetical protein